MSAQLFYGNAHYTLANDEAVAELVDAIEKVIELPGGRGIVTVDLAGEASATLLVSSDIPIFIKETRRPSRPRVIAFGDGGEETA
ncbi:hypothetical protein [Prescottella equi]|uniref:hypothetical protein n=1 Tax=Rhodococcus hoagii TaxID=43767 RepID=UPI00197CBD6A|nr:hypothetical protein [Prescottella equi]NKS67304.1 hypothetical protein [Prescottella equi]NKU91725.1 hypothetical protein [Prescottella equi]NKU95772.1 hypothetical protein [Prescottella equi]NKU95789.1 hypothetical protein [Prescottella equi]NKV63701.1 hypothetical protein [Prescottella equi]